ncbi:MAG: hypothetical protein ABF683_08410 [Sporolactobacillus sp.]
MVAGQKGSGKTTTALQAAHKFGYQFIADESTVLRTGISATTHILEHYQFAGTSLEESMLTLMRLAARPAYEVRYIQNNFESLKHGIAKIVSIAGKA